MRASSMREGRDSSQATRNTGSSAFADDKRRDWPRASISLAKILLHLGAQAVAQVVARHAEGDIGTEETGFRAAIVPLALELDAVEALRFRKADHRIGELDLA